jgi:hypothetical protein
MHGLSLSPKLFIPRQKEDCAMMNQVHEKAIGLY